MLQCRCLAGLFLLVAVAATCTNASPSFPQPNFFGRSPRSTKAASSPSIPSVSKALADPFPTPVFDCPALPPPPAATDVRKLHPGNIKVVMAMGDSITAGFAMKGIPPTDFLEYRDYVFSIGGAADAFTLPNLLKHYNPSLVGAAESWTYPMTKGMWLDAGVSMAKVEDCPSQVAYLVNQLKTTYSGQVDFDNDWKLLTLFIGANNICDICKNDPRDQPAYFEQNLRQVLGLIEQSIPRVFVNVLTIFNISGVYTAGQTREYCRLIWDGITDNECYCLTTGKESDRAAMDVDSVEFNIRTRKVVAEFAAKNNPSFTAVVQPGLENVNISYDGEVFLSLLDCFHPSVYADESFAFQIWNNMFAPPGQKKTAPPLRPWNKDTVKLTCPTAASYLQ